VCRNVCVAAKVAEGQVERQVAWYFRKL